MSDSMRVARIDTAAITRNVERLRAVIGTPHTMAVVKADGYGHGAARVARAALAGGADSIGVVDSREALALRHAGITAPIVCWMHHPNARFDTEIAAGLELGVARAEQVTQVADAAARAGTPAVIHLKVDTGLSRNGAPEAEWDAFFAAAARAQHAGTVEVRGLFSHLSGTSITDDRAQVVVFERAIAMAATFGVHPPRIHLAATGGAIRLPEARYTQVRLGIGMYGFSPYGPESATELGLIPAMELSATITGIKRVPAGTGISYDYVARTEKETTLALVPLGYADGVPRQASDCGPVTIGGRRFRVAGRVAMDQFVVDVGDAPVQVGDRAVLFGDTRDGYPSAEEWATAADTISYDIVTRVGARVERVES